MYKYKYHKTAQEMLRIEKEYLFNQSVAGLTKEQATHILAGMILHMEGRGYNIPNGLKNELVGKNYNWHKNII